MRRRQRGRAEEGARVEGEAGRGCHTACVAGAWRPHGEHRLTRSGAARGNRRGAAQASQRAGQRGGRPGERAGPKRRCGRGVDCWAGFGWRARSEAAARERRETLFQILFSRNFQISVFKYPFEQENDFF